MKQLSTPTNLPLADNKFVSIDDLLFDSKNPRLVECAGSPSQKEILRIRWREFAVDEIALSIAANGFFPYEPPFVTKEDGRLVVVEGNRRLAAVRLLIDADLRQEMGATNLPQISASKKGAREASRRIFYRRRNLGGFSKNRRKRLSQKCRGARPCAPTESWDRLLPRFIEKIQIWKLVGLKHLRCSQCALGCLNQK